MKFQTLFKIFYIIMCMILFAHFVMDSNFYLILTYILWPMVKFELAQWVILYKQFKYRKGSFLHCLFLFHKAKAKLSGVGLLKSYLLLIGAFVIDVVLYLGTISKHTLSQLCNIIRQFRYFFKEIDWRYQWKTNRVFRYFIFKFVLFIILAIFIYKLIIYFFKKFKKFK